MLNCGVGSGRSFIRHRHISSGRERAKTGKSMINPRIVWGRPAGLEHANLWPSVFRPFNCGLGSRPVFLSLPGSWSFPRSWPHADVRVGCLNVCIDVCAPSAETTRSPQHSPDGTSQACCQSCNLRFRSLNGRRTPPFKYDAAGPDAVEDDGELPGDRNLRLFHADPSGQPDAPSLQCAPAFRAME